MSKLKSRVVATGEARCVLETMWSSVVSVAGPQSPELVRATRDSTDALWAMWAEVLS
jgi:hypothetical protein